MLQLQSRPYMCWRCLAQRRSSRPLEAARTESFAPPGRTPAFAAQRRPATTNNGTALATRYDTTTPRQLPLRERLRLWKADDDTRRTNSIESPHDTRLGSGISNLLGRVLSTSSSQLDQLKTENPAFESFGSSGENGDVDSPLVGGDSRTPGDLVELQASDFRVPVLAIYLGFISGRNHFYASNGKWVTSMGFSPLFTVPNFVSLADLAPILAEIPTNCTPDELQDMRNEDRGPSREDGAALIQKLTKFRNDSEAVYQSNISRLDGIQALVASPDRIKYLSLFEIADMLLPDSLKTDAGFSATALYATHTAISRTEFGITPLSPSRDCQRRDHLYEVLPSRITQMTNDIALRVRSHVDNMRTKKKVKDSDPFDGFAQKANEVVSRNRSNRQWTSHGLIGAPLGSSLCQVEWSQLHQDIISFLELWATHGVFSPGSRFHSYGATILRYLSLYGDVPLDQNTAWTFLQEIGWVSSWEISSRYKVRFPNTAIVKGGGLARDAPPNIEDSKRPDIAAGSRRDWSDVPIFCIDSTSTVLVDDGISLERTDRPDEFWINIHTADPASVVNPNSELCKFMELIPSNIYLPGHFQAMLPSEMGEDDSGDYKSESLVKQFSLRPGAPAMTFSAKVNDAGEILDYKIEPGTIHNVKYLEPDDVSAFCEEPPVPPFPEQTIVVGTPPKEADATPNRPMVSAKDLDESSKDDLATLYRLGEALKQQRLAKGAWPYFFPRPSVSVSFPEPRIDGQVESSEELSKGNSKNIGDIARMIQSPPDPYIKVTRESAMGSSVVSNTMVLAGEIAARWCASRGIPIPFRRDVKTAENWGAALAFAKENLYPLVEQGINPSPTQRHQLIALTGGTEIASEPGPYFMLGLEMYTKATSPLRRFSDLLVHWQIHAALAHERRTGRPIDPATDELDKILPFSSSELKTTHSLLDMREKMARRIAAGSEQWILQALVRAWRFEGTAPRSMRFKVESRWKMGVFGRLDLFDLHAGMEVGGINGLTLLKDIRIGDEFEVELQDVSIPSQEVLVKAVKYLGQGDVPATQAQAQQILEGARPGGDLQHALA